MSDATIAWPLIVKAVLERLEKKPAEKKKIGAFHFDPEKICS